jgi:hypothetical protein
MKCPRCGHRTRIVDVFDKDDRCNRRRKCQNKDCNFRYLTSETFLAESIGPGNFSIGRADALEIIALLQAGVLTQKEIAERFCVTQQLVSLINRRKRWGYLWEAPQGAPGGPQKGA